MTWPAPEPPPGVHTRRVREVLADLSRNCPSYRWAVTFTTSRPVMLGLNGNRDLLVFQHRAAALEKLCSEQSGQFRAPELWTRREDGEWARGDLKPYRRRKWWHL